MEFMTSWSRPCYLWSITASFLSGFDFRYLLMPRSQICGHLRKDLFCKDYLLFFVSDLGSHCNWANGAWNWLQGSEFGYKLWLSNLCCCVYSQNRYGLPIFKFKVIPQKLKLPMNFFLNLPWMFSTKHCFEKKKQKKTIKMIGHHSHLRDMMGQSYPIYACTRANHAHYSSVHVKFCGCSKHTLLK